MLKRIFKYCLVSIFIWINNSAQWQQISIPTTEDLFMVRFVSETTGWVVGKNFVYKTTNGGSNWQTQDTVMGGGSEALIAIDSFTVLYADYSWRGIRGTTDGGSTWYSIDSAKYTYWDFKFVNRTLGFAACATVSFDSGIVRRTTDGGIHWKTISSLYLPNGADDFEGISFIDSLNGWVTTYKAWVYHSTDGGFSWKFQDSVGRSRSLLREYVPCRDIQFTTNNSGWVVGGLASETLVARTTNGGLTWNTEILYPFSACSIREIKMINSQTGWFTGANNGGAMLAKTTDGGNSWVDQLPFQAGFESISMINANVGYVVGRNGRIYKTENGGVTSVSENNSNSPQKFALSQNYPNPFNPSTRISWQSPVSCWQTLKLYDVLGNEVSILVDEYKPAGRFEVEFQSTEGRRRLTSGIYIYTLKAGTYFSSKKMILLQ